MRLCLNYHHCSMLLSALGILAALRALRNRVHVQGPGQTYHGRDRCEVASASGQPSPPACGEATEPAKTAELGVGCVGVWAAGTRDIHGGGQTWAANVGLLISACNDSSGMLQPSQAREGCWRIAQVVVRIRPGLRRVLRLEQGGGATDMAAAGAKKLQCAFLLGHIGVLGRGRWASRGQFAAGGPTLQGVT